MAEFLSRLDLYAIGRQFVLTHAKRIDPAQVDVDGSDANLFVGAVAYMAHAISRQNAERVNALLLDGAEREDLDRVAFDRYGYGVVRKGAAAARVGLTFTRPTAAVGAGAIAAGTRLRTLTGLEYVLTTPATFGASTLVATARARAVQAGKSQQVGRNAVRRFAVTPFDPTIEVTNPEPAAGGEDAELDDVFRERVRGFWRAARRGTLGAIEFGALSVPGVESALAQEIVDADAPQRLVELFIADSSGVSNAELAADVALALEEWRAGGVRVVYRLSTPQLVGVSLALAWRAGVDTVALTDQVRASVVAFVNSLGVGAPLLRNDLGAVLSRFRSSGLIPTAGSVVSPAGDLYPDAGATLRTRLELVTT